MGEASSGRARCSTRAAEFLSSRFSSPSSSACLERLSYSHSVRSILRPMFFACFSCHKRPDSEASTSSALRPASDPGKSQKPYYWFQCGAAARASNITMYFGCIFKLTDKARDSLGAQDSSDFGIERQTVKVLVLLVQGSVTTAGPRPPKLWCIFDRA